MQRLTLHPVNPQLRLIQHAVKALQDGELVIYPSDMAYAFACDCRQKATIEYLCRIRRLSHHHQFTLLCRDLATVGQVANLETKYFKLLKRIGAGPYTFILPASKNVPRILTQTKRKTIGIHVPSQPVAQVLLDAFGDILLTSSLLMPNEIEPCRDPDEIAQRYASMAGVFLDCGVTGDERSTVVDLTGDEPQIIREGAGDPALLFQA